MTISLSQSTADSSFSRLTEERERTTRPYKEPIHRILAHVKRTRIAQAPKVARG